MKEVLIGLISLDKIHFLQVYFKYTQPLKSQEYLSVNMETYPMKF